MTVLRERERQAYSTTQRVSHAIDWVVGGIGAVLAIFGVWMRYGPEDGVLTVFSSSWNISEIAQAWPFSLLVGGFTLVAAAFGLAATKFNRSGVVGFATGAAIAGLAALAAAVSFLVIWIG